MTERSIGILGGGISGIALAAHLGENVEVLEKRDRIGGLCGTISEDGFTFDAAGPHIMFSKNKEVLGLMVEVLGDNVAQRRRDNKIWFKGKLVKYPFENDLASLPPQDNFECILGYIVKAVTGGGRVTRSAPESIVARGRERGRRFGDHRGASPLTRREWSRGPAACP